MSMYNTKHSAYCEIEQLRYKKKGEKQLNVVNFNKYLWNRYLCISYVCKKCWVVLWSVSELLRNLWLGGKDESFVVEFI
jgi:hypothetical protein